MDEELFGEGSSSEEERGEAATEQQQQEEGSAEEDSSDAAEENEEEAAVASGSESEASSAAGGEEKSGEEESGNEQEGSDAEPVETGDQETQDASGSDSSDQEAEGGTTEQREASEGGSVGGETPVQSDSDAEQEVDGAEKSGSENEEEGEEQESEDDNKETKDSGSEEDNEETKAADSSDSDSDIASKKPKLTRDSDSSDDDDNKPQEAAGGADLFGDADDISSSSDDDNEKMEAEQIKEEESRRSVLYSDDEEEVKPAVEEEQQETRIEVEIPKINTDLGSAIHFVRFPNFVSVETRPFDPTVYEDEIEDDELLDEEGRTRLKLKVENTIRWKKYTDENGIQLTESNARLVKWSDGSLSMHLGSEIFDVHVMPLQGDHNHLFIRQGTGLQGQAVFKTKLTFRPHSTKSATHRKMTNRLAMRLNQNQQKVRVLPIAGQDPESRKAKLMKEEEDQLRAHMRREAQKRRMREKAHARGLNTNYLDDRLDDDEEGGAISVSAIKNKFRPGFGAPGARLNIYSESDSGDEKLTNAKRLESDDSDDDIDQRNKKKNEDSEGEKKRKKYVVSDSEESDAEDNKETNNETSENTTESQEPATESDDD